MEDAFVLIKEDQIGKTAKSGNSNAGKFKNENIHFSLKHQTYLKQNINLFLLILNLYC